MRILIATPLYPPQAGGPAKYAAGLQAAFQKRGHQVGVIAYGPLERALPPFVRHFVYFFRVLPRAFRADMVLALDAASVGIPAYAAARVVRSTFFIRLGGDFVWEHYVERTKQDVTLRIFNEHTPHLSFKEKLIRAFCGYVLRHADRVVFNSEWFRDIIVFAYGLNRMCTAIVENEMPERRVAEHPKQKNFLFAGRQIALKNGKRVHEAFANAKQKKPELVLEEGVFAPEALREKLRTCYAVLQPSLSDVAPNLVLEALSYGKPFILTRESGLAEPMREYGLIVDPLSVHDIEEAILAMADDGVYEQYAAKAWQFDRTHTFDDIAGELLALL